MVSRIICRECGGWLVENQTGGFDCDTCGIRILSDGTVDKSDCEDEEE